MLNTSSDSSCAQLYEVAVYDADGQLQSVLQSGLLLTGALNCARGFNARNSTSVAVVAPVEVSAALPVPLPHLLSEEHFTADRSLTDWLENWFSGFGDEAMDELYNRAQELAQTPAGQALCDIEHTLSSEQRLNIWRQLLGY